MPVTVSVIMPVYNSGDRLRNPVASVLNQDGAGELFDIELIVVDDCSTDNTREVLAEMGVACLTSNENSGGPNRGRNRGLRAAKGEYICIIDHDDIWHPGKIAAQLKAAESAPVITTLHTISEPLKGKLRQVGTATGGITVYPENESFLKRLARSKEGQNCYPSTIMIHRSLKDILFEEHFGCIDFDWLLKIFHTNRSVQVNLPMMTRIVEEKNLSLNADYRVKEYYYSLMTLEKYAGEYPREVRLGELRTNGTRAKYHYLTGDTQRSRRYFLRSGFSFKTVLYLLTSFVGSGWVRRKFHIFG